MPHSGFVQLHNHSEYSLLDGACRIDGMIQWAKETKAPAIAITDHGNLFGAFEFYKKARNKSVKPIIGCEFYIAPENRLKKAASGKQDAAFHLIALAKDYTGYKNLLQLISLAYIEGFYYVPRIDKELLSQYHEGLIVMTSCLHGEVPYLINSGKIQQAQQTALELKNIMGEGNLYIELQNHFIPEEKRAIPHLIKIAQDLKIPLVATNDCHYLKKEDAEAHDVLLCIQTNKTIDDSKRLRFHSQEFYLKSEAEMRSLFYECPEEAIANSLEIAEKCNLELPSEGFILPEYQVPEGEDANSYLKKLCYKGLEERYSTDKFEKARRQLDYELEVIGKTGFASYFLIVHDYVNFARQSGVPVGPGRGSVGGSVAAYSLGITNFDPLQYDLIFERFLHTERVGMPDIDLDFSPERRDEIIAYVAKKYGSEKVAHIATFGTMAAKAVIRDVGRALNLPLSEVDKVAKLIPTGPNVNIAKSLESVPELKELAKDEEVSKLLKISQSLEGLKRHVSIHASGVVVSRGKLTEYTPILKDTKGQIATQYDMDSLSGIGMVKFDFLGLKTLNVIYDTIKLVEANRNIKIDIDKIPFDDQRTYDLLCEGNVLGVFQFETSAGIKEVVKRLKPRSFEEFIPIRSLYNPGPMESGMLEGYIRRKLGLESVEYIHPLMEPILKNSYGMCTYQEQVLQIARDMAGYTLGQADLLRSAMGKKRPEEMQKHRERFIEGAQKQGVSAEIAKQVFEQIEPFAGYAFPKSHAVAYSIISYQTAYLKANYPVEFMAALMSSDIGNSSQLAQYLSECRKLAIQVLPPDVNESGMKFTVFRDNIRFGLSAIKNVGESAVESTLKTRQSARFKSLFDFCERIDSKVVSRKTTESLIRCGAFGSLDGHRAQMLKALDSAIESAQGVQKDRSVGQTSLFDQLASTSTKANKANKANKTDLSIKSSLPEVSKWSEAENWAAEKELLGVYISGHPLASYSDQIKRYTTASAATLSDFTNGRKVNVAGMITEVRNKIAKNEERMAFVSLEDLEGSIELIFFPKVFSQCLDILKEGNLIWVSGNVNLGRDENESVKLVANEAMPLSEVEEKLSNALHVNIPNDMINETNLNQVKSLIADNQGNCAFFIHLQIQNCGEVTIKSDYSCRTSGTPKVIMQLEEILGDGNVWLSYEN